MLGPEKKPLGREPIRSDLDDGSPRRIGRSMGQFNTIKTLLRRANIDKLVIATDAGREGELVARWIMRLGGWKGTYKRKAMDRRRQSA